MALHTFLLEQLHNNNFLSGGAVLMVIGALGALLRAWPRRIWDSFKGLFIIEVDIPDRDQSFQWINDWLAVHPYGAERARLLTVRTTRDPDSDDDDDDLAYGPGGPPRHNNRQPRIILSPAPGSHYFFYRGRFVILTRTRKDAEDHRADGGTGIRESFTIRVFTRSRAVIHSLLEDARELVHPTADERLTTFTADYSSWIARGKAYPRPLNSVVLPEGMMEDMIARIEQFRRGRNWYAERGIPYRLGFLFKGPGGSGKSSAAIALASYFKLDLALLSLTTTDLTDDRLRDLLAGVPKNALVLTEDIDCVFKQRTSVKDKQNGITFSGLLNAIDGVAAGEGRILVMTTNKPEVLDPALIREGRADYHYEIGLPTAEQRCRLFKCFYPELTHGLLPWQFANSCLGTESMAKLQGHLLKHRDDGHAAINNLCKLGAA